MSEAIEYESAAKRGGASDEDRQTLVALAATLPVTVIEPHPGWKMLNLREIWQFRELLYFLTWRDVKIRYKQSLLGALWAIIQPVMLMVVFTLVFRKKAEVPSDGLPYPLFSFTGLVLWSYFATAITQAGNSVVASQALITKVYFPRLAIPFASVGAALFDFVVSFGVLLAMVGGYYAFWPGLIRDVTITPNLLLIPPILLLTTLAAAAVGTILAALNVAYRDFKYTVPFLVQLWMFATPALYMGSEIMRGTAPVAPQRMPEASSGGTAATNTHTPNADGTNSAKDATHLKTKKQSLHPNTHRKEDFVPDSIQNLVERYNPMAGLVTSFRAALLGHQPIPWSQLGVATIIVIVAFFASCFYFHRVEDTFADII